MAPEAVIWGIAMSSCEQRPDAGCSYVSSLQPWGWHRLDSSSAIFLSSSVFRATSPFREARNWARASSVGTSRFFCVT